MSKSFQILTRLAFAFIVIVIGNYVIVAQTTLKGDWKAKFDGEKTGKIYVSFERRSEKGGTNQMGQNYEFADLQNLSREQVRGTGAPLQVENSWKNASAFGEIN